VLALNQRINVVVLDFDENKKRISLGLKQLTPHPWEVLPADVGEGSMVTGKIVNIEDYGAFVEIQPGVEGLIHVSEITWGNQSVHAKEFFKMGQEVEARVVTIDRGDRKMSLSVKQLTSDPWSEIDRSASRRHPLHRYGEKHHQLRHLRRTERRRRRHGAHQRPELDQTLRTPKRVHQSGQPAGSDGAGHRQRQTPDQPGPQADPGKPMGCFRSVFPVGSYHEATVLKRDDKGATFQLPHGLEAFAPAKHIRKDDGQQADQYPAKC
jgi:small subunit ribosomal protein S1